MFEKDKEEKTNKQKHLQSHHAEVTTVTIFSSLLFLPAHLLFLGSLYCLKYKTAIVDSLIPQD